MNKHLQNERGAALMVTLGVVAILLTLALRLAQLTGDAALHTSAKNDRLAAGELALSGIHLAMLILARDAADNDTDSLQEAWADPDTIQQAVKDLGIDAGSLDLTISDELGKIQLNALLKQFPGHEINTDQQALLERFLLLSLPSNRKDGSGGPAEIVNAIKDWLDSKDDDAVTGLSGAESDYYQALDPPRPCANGPFGRVEDLLNVKGMAKEVLTGPEDKPLELGEIFTVYGMSDLKNEGRYTFPGKININTAPLPVIAALLPEGKEDLAENLAAYREERPGRQAPYTHILEPGWWEKAMVFTEKEKAAFDRKITYSSHIFRADCKAVVNHSRVRLSGVIQREKEKETGKWISRMIQLERP